MFPAILSRTAPRLPRDERPPLHGSLGPTWGTLAAHLACRFPFFSWTLRQLFSRRSQFLARRMFVGNKIVRKIGNLIGRMGMADRRREANAAVPMPKEASGPLNDEYTIQQGPSGVPLTIATMTPDQLEARRIAQV